MPPRSILLSSVLLAMVMAAGAAFLMAALRAGSRTGEAGASPLSAIAVPEFELVDHDGRPIDRSILDGHYTVLDFIFTNCPTWCPGMTLAMKRVQDATAGSDVRLLSISVDPERDTPEVLRAFALSYGADLDRWTFATGDDATVRRIVTDGFMFALDTLPDQPIVLADNTTMDMIEHPTRLILLGKDRSVVGMYSYQSEADVARLIANLKQLTD